MKDSIIRLGGGRRLCFRDSGSDDLLPVIALHGTPGSRLKFVNAEAEAKSLGVRLITPDRWGYGRSDAPLRPALERYGADIEQLTSQLGIDTFAVLGLSGGGPYAAAVAATLGSRVRRLALVSPVGPIAGCCTWQ